MALVEGDDDDDDEEEEDADGCLLLAFAGGDVAFDRSDAFISS